MKRWARAVTITVALGLATSLFAWTAAHAAEVTVTNATQFTATNGEAVHAHGGGVIKVGSYYYWFGENRNSDNTFRYVSAYRSADLKTWEFRNHVLTQATDPELAVANIERPKVIYNNTTGEYVMWMHKENGKDYLEARAAVAVSSTVDGDYTWRGSFRPLGYMSRDITLFTDNDGTGYMISAANDNADLHVYRLTADYRAVEARVQRLWPGSYREAPAMFKRNGVYFLLTSGATGWSPNQQKYATATSVAGTWSGLANIGDSTAYKSQTAYVLPVQGSAGTSYLYLGDRWGNSFGGTVNDSLYIWLPLTFPTDTTMRMDYYPQLSIDAAAGTVAGIGGPWQTLTARHSGKCADISDASLADNAAAIQWSCNRGLNQQWWLKDAGGGYHQIVSRNSGRCLDVTAASTANGARVIQYACHSGTNQQWQLQDTGNGYVRLVARHSGKCLDVNAASTADGAYLIQYTCHTGSNQHWTRTTI